MAIVIARVDDRLIHGQVVEGWLRVIQAGRIVVACDDAAGDPLQGRLMRLAVPSEVKVDVLTVEKAVDVIREESGSTTRVMVLMPSLKEARQLVEMGAPLTTLNLGGLHDAPKRKMITPSLFLSDDDKKDIAFLASRKVAMETRCLPCDDKTPVEEILKTI